MSLISAAPIFWTFRALSPLTLLGALLRWLDSRSSASPRFQRTRRPLRARLRSAGMRSLCFGMMVTATACINASPSPARASDKAETRDDSGAPSDDSLDEFVPPGVIRVTPEALNLARAFLEAAHAAQPGKDWIVAFCWSTSRRVQAKPPHGAWVEHGPGLDVGGYERHLVPAAAIQIIDGMEILMHIDRTLWMGPQRTIDVNQSVPTDVVLR